MLTREQIGDVAEYVLSLSGQEHDAAAAERGAAIFAEQCAACHGEERRGQPGARRARPRPTRSGSMAATSATIVAADPRSPRTA